MAEDNKTNFSDVAISGALTVTGAITAASIASALTGGVTGNVAGDLQGNVLAPTQVISAAGPTAITIKSGTVMLTKADGICAVTLADPTAGADDGKQLTVISESAQAHTLTIAGGLNGGGAGADVGTFGGAIGDYCQLVAYNGKWHGAGKLNVTFA